MKRHTHKHPTPCRRFSWGRIPHESGCTWRLFRRDIDGKAYMSGLTFRNDTPQAEIAASLRAARKALLAKVDAVGFAKLGVAA